MWCIIIYAFWKPKHLHIILIFFDDRHGLFFGRAFDQIENVFCVYQRRKDNALCDPISNGFFSFGVSLERVPGNSIYSK